MWKILTILMLATTPALAQSARTSSRGLSDDPAYFPIAVWLQNPRNAQAYKDVGINLYVGLHKGPTDAQLAALENAGMPVVCRYEAQYRDRKIIVGWMHSDEPDNAQPKPKGQKGYNPPITPAKIIADYRQLKKQDPTRPVILNLGMGVAWDGWHGRGVRTNHPEDYPEYVQGADVVSFDIYPVVAKQPEIKGQLELVPFGVERLRKWAGDKKPVWTCIEATHINNPDVKPTPQQVRSEVWMAIIHGARGLIYFSHQFKPTFIEAGILADEEMAAAVKDINQQVTELAAVINSPDPKLQLVVKRSGGETPISTMVRKHDGATYVFAAAMGDGDVTGQFNLPVKGMGKVEVLGENRTIEPKGGGWTDAFKGYEVHLYRVADR